MKKDMSSIKCQDMNAEMLSFPAARKKITKPKKTVREVTQM